ncbi:MAG TPA: type III PLP-dependent enzyme [Steroidobacteraceae bacterium]|jgi:ornithine decarboxylase|nr:type III PLP-dependent enzyme [Steroidobacteraceae bacterium]
MAKAASSPRSLTPEPLELDPALDPFAHESIRHLVTRYGSPLFVIDAERVRRQYRRLEAALPGVDLHYALKPLPHPSVINTLNAEGAFFDLATNGEVELVRRLKIAPERCIHTHPIKRESDIRTALAYGVSRFIIDNPDELRKFVKYRNRTSLLIRVAFSSSEAVADLSRKFGCEPQAVSDLTRLAAELRITIDGLSFHVGSQSPNPAKFIEAISICRELLRDAVESGHDPRILDIGGGFPVDYLQPSMPIEEFCAPIRAALNELPSATRVIAEPGRYIAAPSAISVTSVMGRALRGVRWWYYLDDGLYGSYSGQVYDRANYPVEALVTAGKTYPSVLAGPTCDSIDVINDRLELPKLDVGDLLIGRAMGAYTWASASEFNFFPRATVLALDNGRLLTDRSRR